MTTNQISRQLRQPVVVICRETIRDSDIAAFDEARRFQSLMECAQEQWVRIRSPAVEISDHGHCRLLRPRRERPRDGTAAETRDDLAPPHSITSSARPSSESGTGRPSALAVFRLMYSSTLVDCWTGRSAGFSPLRTRPVYMPTRRRGSVKLPP